jgi:hypothetical protein
MMPSEARRSAAAEVGSHPRANSIGSLCFDVLSRCAEDRRLNVQRRALRLRAQAHGLSSKDAETSVGNVLTLLERGPERPAEWAIVGAFFVLGLERALSHGTAVDRREIVERFARHADWLELTTPYAPYRFVGELLSESHRALLIEVLETALLASAEGPSLPALRARAMLRIQVLETFSEEQARVALSRAAELSPDAAVAAAARMALGEAPAVSTDGFELDGTEGRAPRFSLLRIVQYVTGVALVLVLLGWLRRSVGYERVARLRIVGRALHVNSETWLFGRRIREGDSSFALDDVTCVSRELILPTFHLVLGATALGVASVLGVGRVSDGVARSDSDLMLLGVLTIAAGVAIDLLSVGWGRFRKPRSALELFVRARRVLALERVDPQRAAAFVEQMASRQGQGTTKSIPPPRLSTSG